MIDHILNFEKISNDVLHGKLSHPVC